MRQLTLGWLTLINAAQPDVISAAAEAGFNSVSIRITGRKPGDGFPVIPGNAAAMRDVKKRLQDGNLRLSNTSTYHVSKDITLDMLKPSIDATAELGASITVVTCTDPDHRRWAEIAGRYCEMARQAKLKVALEFVPFSEAKTLDAALKLLDMIGAPNLGLLLDPLHVARSGGHPSDLRKVKPEQVTFAQLCDARADHPGLAELPNEARTGRLYPGDGALPLYDFLDALPQDTEIECESPRIDFAGLSPVEQARRAGDALRGFLAQYDKARGRR